MWDRGLAWAILLAMGGGLAAIAAGYWIIGELVTVSDRAISPAQRFTAAFAVATALGVLVALVVNIRKQNLAEQLARREITTAFTERFRSAAQQLGGESPAERLAGVYAMAALADEYPTRRQQCVDVLCGYLRLPFDPTTDHLADQSTTTTHAFQDGRTHTTHQNPASRPFDQQVRETIVTVIHDHTQTDAPVSWSALRFDLRGAHLTNVDLIDTVFSGRVLFDGVTFSGKETLFEEAAFDGWGGSSFTGATFAGDVFFGGAKFLGGEGLFDGASFAGRALFGHVTFGQCFHFEKAKFAHGASFANATFAASGFFDGATFAGDSEFDGVTFAKDVWFDNAGAQIDIAKYPQAVWSERAFLREGASVHGLENVVLEDGASITRGGEPFRGWPPVNGSDDQPAA